ncbi:hypothetical protein SNE25_01615 [Mucilaginibacter sabulilitoris]|uniref:Uncharacterized protein n=1 Tax=Mucilaginibacter sabulilitoris TaxID=1173583 RepID=A0ABZ0TN87_9SPHI|nr:hypothetical protein [Mucilaginibacter sabulilitoris]WPU94221.1 hypothetical protein SNE25_01615 [Mucilaginibacter sabulilitoris]
MIKFLLIILAASFLFTCVAEAQSEKRMANSGPMPLSPLNYQSNKQQFCNHT